MPAASRVKRSKPDLLSDIEMRADSTRVLHRLNEPGACLAVAADMDQGVVVREDASGQTIRIAVADRQVIEAMALTDWIACTTPGRIARYHITAAGRAALRQQLAEAGKRPARHGRSRHAVRRGRSNHDLHRGRKRAATSGASAKSRRCAVPGRRPARSGRAPARPLRNRKTARPASSADRPVLRLRPERIGARGFRCRNGRLP